METLWTESELEGTGSGARAGNGSEIQKSMHIYVVRVVRSPWVKEGGNDRQFTVGHCSSGTESAMVGKPNCRNP